MKSTIKFSTIAFFVFMILTCSVEAQQLIGVLRLIADKPISSGRSSKGQTTSTELHVYGVFKMETNKSNDDDDDDDKDNFIPEYKLLKKKENLTPEVLEAYKGISIQDAVNRTISSCNCGEFLMNAEIYSYNNAFVVVGDVYGIESASCIFHVGDTVSWGDNLAGVIVNIKNEDVCIVKSLLTERQKEINFSDIFKVSSDFYYFKIGDKISWKVGGKYKSGVIVAIRDENKCLVKDEITGQQKNIYTDELFKMGTDK